MAQYTWPPVSFSGNSNPSVGVNGDAIPTSSTQVAGSDGTNLRPVKVGTDGTQYVFLSAGSASVGTVSVASGTINSLASGTIAINTGTLSNLASGTVTINAGTLSLLAAGTVSINTGTLSNLASGTVTLTAATISTLTSGTVAINTGTLSLLAAGTVTINAGTLASLTSGTVTINAGTLASLTSGTVTLTGSPAISGTVNAKATTPTAGTVNQQGLTVGTTAVLLVGSGTAVQPTRSVLVVTIDNASTAKFYIGNSSVTNSGTSNRGIQLTAGQNFVANNDAGAYYIISDTAAQTVYVMEQA